PMEPNRLIRGDAEAAPLVQGVFRVLAVPPTQDEAALRRTNLLMGELLVAALGIDQEMRLSGTPAWISLCRTISFGMALDLLELCRLRELGLHADRNDPHFTA